MTMYLAVWLLAGVGRDCPFCPPAGPTCSEQLSQAEFAVVVRWLKMVTPEGELEGADAQIHLEVIEVLHQREPKFRSKQTLVLSLQLEGKPGQWWVLLANTRGSQIDWHTSWEASEEIVQYLKQAPPVEAPASQRLRYFWKFLEAPIPFMANDAFAEFSSARYPDVASLAPYYSRERLRRWLDDPEEAKQVRHGFYGLLLGLCGHADDADYLAHRVLAPPPPDRPRLGIDGLMAGYVLLTGEAGLNRLVAAKLQAPHRYDSEVTGLMNTLRFLWEYAPEKVPRGRIAEIMRQLLSDQRHGELALFDLGRWKDWDSLDDVLAQFGHPPFETELARQRVVEFVLRAERDLSAQTTTLQQKARLQQAQAFLRRIRNEDPELYQAAQRWLQPARTTSSP
ncbi:MAG: hypothetical protein KatS3mg113_0682 [Planctomycetaceae bacterium]|nr:MAG: hypothetical protein KatS3mg113_0682 [Planctomycetaceae bacterium]